MVALRNALKELLYPRHNLSYLRCGDIVTVSVSPWYSGSFTPPKTVIPFFTCYWLQGIRNSSGESQSASSVECLLWLLAGALPARFETKTSRPAELKIVKTGSKNFLSGLME